jgi:hypothetical protein
MNPMTGALARERIDHLHRSAARARQLREARAAARTASKPASARRRRPRQHATCCGTAA